VVVGPEHHVGSLRGFEHFMDIAQWEGKGFFAQDMFSGLGRRQGLVMVQFVGRADVNYVDFRIAQELVQLMVGFGDAVLCCVRFRPLRTCAAIRDVAFTLYVAKSQRAKHVRIDRTLWKSSSNELTIRHPTPMVAASSLIVSGLEAFEKKMHESIYG
jgi:hypothetical protein